jgi:hypothetical protein
MKLSDKMKTVDANISITRYDNGWTIEIGGATSGGNWRVAKRICTTEEELFGIIKEWNSLKLSD